MNGITSGSSGIKYYYRVSVMCSCGWQGTVETGRADDLFWLTNTALRDHRLAAHNDGCEGDAK